MPLPTAGLRHPRTIWGTGRTPWKPTGGELFSNHWCGRLGLSLRLRVSDRPGSPYSGTHDPRHSPPESHTPHRPRPRGFHANVEGSTRPGTALPASARTTEPTGPSARSRPEGELARPAIGVGSGTASHPAGTSVGAAAKEAPASHRPGPFKGRALAAEAGCGLVTPPRRGFRLAAASGVLRGGGGAGGGRGGRSVLLPARVRAPAGARQSPPGPRPSSPGRSGRATVRFELR